MNYCLILTNLNREYYRRPLLNIPILWILFFATFFICKNKIKCHLYILLLSLTSTNKTRNNGIYYSISELEFSPLRDVFLNFNDHIFGIFVSILHILLCIQIINCLFLITRRKKLYIVHRIIHA